MDESITEMIAKNRSDRKAPRKVDLEHDGPVIGESEIRTARFPGRTVHIGEGRDSTEVPESIEEDEGKAEGSSHHRV